jgi:hypothetical protein
MKPRLAPVNRLRFDKAAKQTTIDVAIHREDGARQNNALLMMVVAGTLRKTRTYLVPLVVKIAQIKVL